MLHLGIIVMRGQWLEDHGMQLHECITVPMVMTMVIEIC